MITQDTIAAISTAVLPAARIIIRLSGPNSLQIAKIISKQTAIAHGSAQQCMLWFCDLQCPGWIYAFHVPRSYTGEDTIEFHIPGNPVLARLLLDDLHRQGARPAEPGEFTARAFFNGKLGLTQAEGVAATIAAGNDAELLAARRLMAGELSRRLAPITEQLTQTLALIEVGIDFSEEDVTFLAHEEVSRRIQIADADLQTLLKHSARFEQLTHEPVIVLAGRPNAGKSTLINTLCGQERAVVADVSGTTRDVLTAPLNLKRGRVVLCDMAGLELISAEEHAQSRIVQQMQQRAQRAMESADHIVLVVDSTDPQLPLQLDRAPALLVQTKSDLKPASDVNWDLDISCKTGEGLQKLRDALDAIAFGQSAERTTLALNRRHLALIDEARVALSRAKISAADHASELVAMDLRDALDSLGSITGTVTPDDVLGRVFSAFCIGK